MFGFLKKKRIDPAARLKSLLQGYQLPSFPGVVLAALEEIRNDDGSVASVAQVIQRDPGLSIRLLKLVNSASYGSARKTESVQQAVSMLGMSQVESMLLSIGVRTALPRCDTPGFEVKRFWLAAARRAEVASGFARVLHPSTRQLSFTAALLGDMAVPLLADAKGDLYSPLLQEWHAGGAPLETLEQELLGCHHGDVGTWLCNEWSLPESLAEAIGAHHGDPDLICPPAIALVSKLRETSDASGIDELVADAEVHGIAADDAVVIVTEGFVRGDALASLFG